MQFTFRVQDLLNLIASNADSAQVIVEAVNGKFSAQMRPVEGMSAMDVEPVIIDGCPFPPGCTP